METCSTTSSATKTMAITPPRKILLVVTVGGYTHAAPILNLGRVLSSRGHTIELATLEGQENWTQDYISRVHTMGKGPSQDSLDHHYLRMRDWDVRKGFGDVMESKFMFDSYWTQTYFHLKAFMQDPLRKPDMIIADFFVDAAKDMQIEFNIPIAILWPQMPFLMLNSSYIPGQPGLQTDMTLTSEHASIASRLRNEFVILRSTATALRYAWWFTSLRRKAGVTYPPELASKPNYLLFVNSFFGLETPKDLPPLAHAVGPILCDEYPPLRKDEPCTRFLNLHKRVVYLALGSHIVLKNNDMLKLVEGLRNSMRSGDIDGVLWAVSERERRDFVLDTALKTEDGKKPFTLGGLLNGQDPDWLFLPFVPQRGVLDHDNVKVYVTHGGGSSANEGLYHGKPMLAIGFFFDQICNAARLEAGGSCLSLSKFTFTALEIASKIHTLLTSPTITLNCQRLQRIAHIASRRKHFAADLIEEFMYDTELRFDEHGKELRPAHLQTADMRMPFWKSRNWDLAAIVMAGMGGVVWGAWVTGRLIWMHRGLVRPVLRKLGLLSISD